MEEKKTQTEFLTEKGAEQARVVGAKARNAKRRSREMVMPRRGRAVGSEMDARMRLSVRRRGDFVDWTAVLLRVIGAQAILRAGVLCGDIVKT